MAIRSVNYYKMDLNQRKKELKQELPKMGIPYVIKALKLIVPSGVEKHNMLINFESEYDEWEVKRMKGIVTGEQFGTAKADIRDRLLLFIDRLKEADLKKTVLQEKEEQKTLHKKGSLLYQIPKRMQVLQPAECVVRIAFDEALLMENLEIIDETKIQSLKRVTNRMKVEMVDATDDNFEIKAISDSVQAIHEEDFTEWEFLVRPLREGTHTLRIKATTMIIVDGIETPHEKVFKKKIDITAEEVIPEAAPFEVVDDNYSYYSPESISTTAADSGIRLPKSIRMMSIALLALMVTSTASYAFIPAVQLEADWFYADKLVANKEAYEDFSKKYEKKNTPTKKIKERIQKAEIKVEDFEYEEAIADTTGQEAIGYFEKYPNQPRYKKEVTQHIEMIVLQKVESIQDTIAFQNALQIEKAKFQSVSNVITVDSVFKEVEKKVIISPSPKTTPVEVPKDTVSVSGKSEAEIAAAEKAKEEQSMLEEKKKKDTARKKADKTAWKIAQTTNTIAAYENYKKQYPNGIHIAKATQEVTKIKQAETVAIKKAEEEKLKAAAVAKKKAEEEKRKQEAERTKVTESETTIFKKGTFTDPRNSMIYPTITFNGKTWMAKNLNYEMTESHCYKDDESNCKTYGRLYTWEAAKKACPKGWHLPSDKEWQELLKTNGGGFYNLGGDDVGDYNKSYQLHIKGGDSGFAALLGGVRISDGEFINLGEFGYYWSATENGADYAWYYSFSKEDGEVYRNFNFKSNAFSCRCVKD